MLSRSAKACYFAIARPFMWLNGLAYRLFRAPTNGEIRVHLGPGQRNYLPGWINLDANMFTAHCDAWVDLRHSLPFRSNSVTCFYSHHVIEHLPHLHRHLLDVFRCLKPGGVYRLAGPHGDMAINAFTRNALDWFPDFPIARRSLGGRFENFVFCQQEHLTILTESFLRELLDDVGFETSRPLLPTRESNNLQWFRDCLTLEYEDDFVFPHTLVLEATKPI